MPSPRETGHGTVRVLGVHRIPIDDELVANAVLSHYGDEPRSEEESQELLAETRAELETIVMIEMAVDQPNRRFNLTQIGQSGSDQAAYDERYLSEDGESVASDWEQPDSDTLRIAFYFHYFDPSKPLRTTYGEVSIPEITPMPERLWRLHPYEPYD